MLYKVFMFMMKTITTASIVSTAMAITFALAAYLLQVEFDGVKLTAQELKEHEKTSAEKLYELKMQDAIMVQRVLSLEKKIDDNSNKLDHIIAHLSKLK
jgi:hypothetical protein